MTTPRLLLIAAHQVAEDGQPLVEALATHQVTAWASPDVAEGMAWIGPLRPDVVVLGCAVADPPLRRVVSLVRAEVGVAVVVGVHSQRSHQHRHRAHRDGSGGGDTGMAALAAGASATLACPFAAGDLARIAHSTVRARDEEAGPTTPPALPDGTRGVLRHGPLELDPGGIRAWIDGYRVDLTHREFELLYHLVLNCGRVVPRREVWSAVWGRRTCGSSDTIGLYVRRLRAKLAVGTAPLTIRTVRGSGYVLTAAQGSPEGSQPHGTPGCGHT
ncbi:winged helix-turn-helix domain-containing protein [Lipingzhangella sp. LS1_29]|uniref:Winged helix-turn-helix domain-containing protein n=1 Tax=Lipingzhangella rawalii TaxID=2055835 RepID=A0ABU2H8D8_9ACTN|nr:winged helix-turn-helix domain-containing protein [Lipingzhangella rawalii]MDS1271100.1 winged helix-turn-helix domain-containing protein [Lipingzhangella rawalii]